MSCDEPDAPGFLDRPGGSRVAYRAVAGDLPGVVFLGGFASDMTGTKARTLEAHCRARGRAYVRFDYFGHGASSGRFEDATLGRWTEDALAVLDRLTRGPQVLVGSSMGGWVMVLAALARSDRVRGLVGVAAAPDFSEDLIRPRLSEEDRRTLEARGVLYRPNPYGEAPTPITGAFLREAREHLVLRAPIPLSCPVRLLHGLADPDVPWQTSLRLAEALESPDVALHLVKGAGHRLSDPPHLERLCALVDELAG